MTFNPLVRPDTTSYYWWWVISKHTYPPEADELTQKSVYVIDFYHKTRIDGGEVLMAKRWNISLGHKLKRTPTPLPAEFAATYTQSGVLSALRNFMRHLSTKAFMKEIKQRAVWELNEKLYYMPVDKQGAPLQLQRTRWELTRIPADWPDVPEGYGKRVFTLDIRTSLQYMFSNPDKPGTPDTTLPPVKSG